MLAAGAGAKDVRNFQMVLDNGTCPSYSSITHEGIFYEHYFDVGTEDEALFSCDWSFASSKDPISGKMEHYIGCGLRCKLDGDGIKKHGRPPVDLVIVLDISGSMDSSFQHYETATKMEVAKDCVISLLGNLRPTDSFGLVTFNKRAQVVQDLALVEKLDLASIKEKVLNLKANNGTDMSVGIKAGMDLFKDNQGHHSRRVMFLTDAQPNLGSTKDRALFSISKQYSEQNLFTTFIGLGVDFGVKLVDAISQIKGCNYFTVSASSVFKKLMSNP
jgi:Ca-activated chloride channel family protein